MIQQRENKVYYRKEVLIWDKGTNMSLFCLVVPSVKDMFDCSLISCPNAESIRYLVTPLNQIMLLDSEPGSELTTDTAYKKFFVLKLIIGSLLFYFFSLCLWNPRTGLT